MIIHPLYAAPQHASCVTGGSGERLALTRCRGRSSPALSNIARRRERCPLPLWPWRERLLGTVGLWRCDLISRQDLYPWMAALYVAPEARGRGAGGKTTAARHRICQSAGLYRAISLLRLPRFFMSVLAGSISAKAWIIRPAPSVYTATIYRCRGAQSPSDGGPAWG